MRFRGKEVTGELLFEKPREVAVRIPYEEFAEMGFSEWEFRANPIEQIKKLADVLARDSVAADYDHHNYHNEFSTRLMELESDRSCRDGSLIMSLELPGKVTRKLKTTDD